MLTILKCCKVNKLGWIVDFLPIERGKFGRRCDRTYLSRLCEVVPTRWIQWSVNCNGSDPILCFHSQRTPI